MQQLSESGITIEGLGVYAACVLANVMTSLLMFLALKWQTDRDRLARITRTILLLDAMFDMFCTSMAGYSSCVGGVCVVALDVASVPSL